MKGVDQFNITKKLAPTWQRIISGAFAITSIFFIITDLIGTTKSSNDGFIEIAFVMFGVFLFSYFAIKGYLPKPFNK